VTERIPASLVITFSCWSDSVEIRFQNTIDDYVEAQRAYQRHRFWYDAYPWLAIVCVLVALYLVLFVDVYLALGPLLSAAWFMLPRLLFPWRMRRDFHKHPHFALESDLVAAEEGLRLKSDLGEGFSKWAAFTKWHETENLFMLYTGVRQFRIIPKRAFEASQLSEFRELLRRKLSSK
jgi:hypothetical protein